MLIAPGVSHSTINHSRDAFAYFSVHFGVEDVDLRNNLKNLNYLLINEPVDKLTALFLEVEHWALKEPMAGNAPSSAASIGGTPLYSVRQKLRFQSIFLQMLFEVLLFLPKSLEVDSLQQKKLNVAEIELARKIEKILTGAIFTNIAIQDIAKSLFISRSHCNEVFKKVYGLSPQQFISMLKLAKAKMLILHSDHSMESISDQLGFSCISSFSRQFRRWTSFSPIQFKNRGEQ
jgi:AraC-like DNA-binding protein